MEINFFLFQIQHNINLNFEPEKKIDHFCFEFGRILPYSFTITGKKVVCSSSGNCPPVSTQSCQNTFAR